MLLMGVGLGCSPKENEKQKSSKQSFHLEVVDSVLVEDIIARQLIFQTASEEFLFFRDGVHPRVLAFTQDGVPVHDWTKEGDDPGAFIITTDNLICTQEGNVVTHDSMNGIRVFQPNGDLVFSKRSEAGMPSSFHKLFNIYRDNQVIEKEGVEYLLHHRDVMEAGEGWNHTFFAQRKNLLVTNLENGETKNILPFPKGSKFLNGKAFAFEDFRPVFYFDEDAEILYLAFQNEDILYMYDFSSDQPALVRSLPLNIPGFGGNKGRAFEEIDFGELVVDNYPARILSMEMVDDKILISYTRAATSEELRDLQGVMVKETRRHKMNELWKKLSSEVMVLRDEEVVTYQMEMPDMAFNSFRVIGEDIWFMKPLREEVEQEDFLVYKARLVEK